MLHLKAGLRRLLQGIGDDGAGAFLALLAEQHLGLLQILRAGASLGQRREPLPEVADQLPGAAGERGEGGVPGLLQEGWRVGGQHRCRCRSRCAGRLSPALSSWRSCRAWGGPPVERRVFRFGFGPWHVVHHPVRTAVAVLGGLVADVIEVFGGQVRFMDFVHLLFDVIVVRVALLRGEGTVLGVQERGMGVMVLEGGEEFIAEDFVAALGRRREGFEVVVVQGPGGGAIEDLPIRLVEEEIDGVGCRAVGQPLAREDHAVAGEARFEGPLSPIVGFIVEFGRDIRSSVCVKRLFHLAIGSSTRGYIQVFTHLFEAVQPDDLGEGSAQCVDAPVDNERVEFVRQLARCTKIEVRRDLPVQLNLALGVFLGDVNMHPPLLGEVMDREPREHGFRPDDGERCERSGFRVFLLLRQVMYWELRHWQDLFSGPCP